MRLEADLCLIDSKILVLYFLFDDYKQLKVHSHNYCALFILKMKTKLFLYHHPSIAIKTVLYS